MTGECPHHAEVSRATMDWQLFLRLPGDQPCLKLIEDRNT